jgi:type IX secretion system PorP/SprF family membrane protein
MSRLKITLLALSFCLVMKIKAQQDPMYSQYMFNIQVVNPAYAGTWERVGFMALTRLQWAGIENAPQTNTFSFQAPYSRKKVGMGLSVITDEIGHENRLMVMGDYSYRLNINRSTWLRFGIKGGFVNYSNDLNKYTLQNTSDPAYQGVIEQEFIPNFGVGLFLHSDRYYFGASVPKLLETKFDVAKESNYSVSAETRHWFIMGGYVLPLNEEVKFKPSFLTKIVRGAPAQIDFNASFLIREKFWVGAMYRTNKAYGANVQFVINDQIRLGYSVDYGSGSFYRKSNGIHEVMISYELKRRKKLFRSPRYF